MASIYKGLLALQQLSCLWLLLVWALCLNHCTLPVGMAKELIPKSDLSNHNETGICKSVDIRNSIKAFESLIGCRVVEGFVQILLFDNVDSSQYANLSFPLLTEITDYLLLYRVSGLLSLGQLFPNLVVIRGYSLLFGYAFIVFEMPNLQEINLYSLTDIMRGSIRIDKNPSLCFVHSIRWELITHDQHGHFIMSIKSENECPLCPGDDDTVDKKCPQFPTKGGSRSVRHMCWNAEHCQKVCSDTCPGRACDENGKCCDEMCLGGCSVNDRNNCTVCKNFTMINDNQRKCLSHCPGHLYEYLHRKCVSQEECIRFSDNRVQQDFPYRIYNRSCVMECPKDYMDDTLNRKCVPCEGKCEKVCPGRIVDGVNSIRELGGCTHINGSLEIQIRGGQNIVHELEENLKLITVIDGYLKIVRSFPLISLSFFKNLDTIRGNVLENNRYVISLLDNQNLQDIWDWTNRSLKVTNGRLFSHFNPKLCVEKIRDLQEKTKLPEFEEHEVSKATNGDKIACNVTEFTVSVIGIQSNEVELQWKKYNIIDPRKLLAFLIYYIEAPYTNVTLYDNRDACGDYGWNVIEVSIPENYTVVTHMSRILGSLKPYTQYAFYITTYTIATEQVGARSKIQYFRTDADQPSVPMKFQITSNSSDSLNITWLSPTDPNGNITHFKITIIKQTETQFPSLAKQDYCNRDIQLPAAKPQETSSPTIPIQPNDTCVCRSKQKTKLVIKESERSSQISFEDELLNKVYIRRTRKDKNQSRKKRESDGLNEEPENTDTEITTGNSTLYNANVTYDNITFATDGFDLYVEKLHHYTMYSVILQACRAKVTNNTKRECSSEEYKNLYKTLPKEGADNITSGVSIDHKNFTSVTLKWKPPDQPNGFILFYRIEYSRLDFHNPYTRCINHYAFKTNGFKYTLNGLNPGNYWVRVLAVSQAKISNDYTERINFYIEESSNYDMLYILGSLICLIIIMLFIFVLYKRHVNIPLIITVNPDYVSREYEPDEWEVLRKKIELHKELGQGSFGMVYEGLARDIKGKSQVPCAIKTVNEHATNRERIEFLNEASVMKAFDTAHVVKLLGVVSQGQPTLVVMELMANGDLKSYLRSHRPESDNYSSNIIKQPPTLKRILQMAIEIADGMAYLSAKKFVHRDLAARNCMVSEDLTVKIGDFGMTRDIYETDYYRKGTKGLLPVRWMAPESLKDGVFSSSSDIWSYGVVLWEMATLASQPYQGLSNDQVLRYVIDGGIMERPENCPDKLYLLMMYCWKHKYTDRPTFLEICSLLLDDGSPLFAKLSFYHSSAGIEARSARHNHLITHDNARTPLRLTNHLDGNYSLDTSEPGSEQDDALVGNTHLEFSSYPVQKDSSATVNGYLGTNASNGTTA